jgi:hypothetical protein
VDYAEKSDAIRVILREDPVLGRAATGTPDARLSPEQRRRAERFLEEGRGREQRCFNRGNRREGRRSHAELTRNDSVVSVMEFEEPWHLWCRACNEEGRGVNSRLTSG